VAQGGLDRSDSELHAALKHLAHAELASDLTNVRQLALVGELELRAITNSNLKRASAMMMFSTMPSVKYSCSGSPLRFWRCKTAIDGLSGNANGVSYQGRNRLTCWRQKTRYMNG